MKIIAVYSSKGGVGKTATSVNLAYTASSRGYATLLCDIDPQGASSYYFRIRPKKKFSGKKLIEGDIDKYIRGTDYDDLDVLPAHFSFRNLDLIMDRRGDEYQTLKDILSPLAAEYDVIFLDCPPNLTLLSEDIIRSADMVITPVIPTTLSILALDQLLKLFKKTSVDKKKIHAFFSMVEKRKSMHIATILKYKDFKIFMRTLIPFLAEVEKMGIHRQPVGAGEGRSAATVAYDRLWKEIEERGQLR
jgi:cellulose biosynthesis protein BcsQ